jgi:hypothetical protein
VICYRKARRKEKGERRKEKGERKENLWAVQKALTTDLVVLNARQHGCPVNDLVSP